MLTRAEVECLFRLGQFNERNGVTVEIGSWKGKSTAALGRGTANAHADKVYAIDPHRICPEEGYFEDTEAEFLVNLKHVGVHDHAVPMIMTSEEASRGWNHPVRVLWIDSDHRYEAAKLDFTLWEPHLVEGGIVAMHDTIRKKGPKRVLWKSVFRSGRFQEIAIVDNITAARGKQRPSRPPQAPSAFGRDDTLGSPGTVRPPAPLPRAHQRGAAASIVLWPGDNTGSPAAARCFGRR
jgi:predicted O-methyltransferase YrrM